MACQQPEPSLDSGLVAWWLIWMTFQDLPNSTLATLFIRHVTELDPQLSQSIFGLPNHHPLVVPSTRNAMGRRTLEDVDWNCGVDLYKRRRCKVTWCWRRWWMKFPCFLVEFGLWLHLLFLLVLLEFSLVLFLELFLGMMIKHKLTELAPAAGFVWEVSGCHLPTARLRLLWHRLLAAARLSIFFPRLLGEKNVIFWALAMDEPWHFWARLIEASRLGWQVYARGLRCSKLSIVESGSYSSPILDHFRCNTHI